MLVIFVDIPTFQDTTICRFYFFHFNTEGTYTMCHVGYYCLTEKRK